MPARPGVNGAGGVAEKAEVRPEALALRPAKHSLTLAGHRTSVSLEAPFWAALQAAAAAGGEPVNALAARIDAARPPDVGLATAIRLFVLDQALGARRSSDT
jgi:predicted DNA-binding ribbon-helix-helix protein